MSIEDAFTLFKQGNVVSIEDASTSFKQGNVVLFEEHIKGIVSIILVVLLVFSIISPRNTTIYMKLAITEIHVKIS